MASLIRDASATLSQPAEAKEEIAARARLSAPAGVRAVTALSGIARSAVTEAAAARYSDEGPDIGSDRDLNITETPPLAIVREVLTDLSLSSYLPT